MAPLTPNDTTTALAVTRISIQNNIFEFQHTPPPPFVFQSNWLGCVNWLPIQKSALFQLANVCFFIAYITPTGAYGSLFLHSSVILGTSRPGQDRCSGYRFPSFLGYLLYATWAWNVVCAPSIFTWAFVFVILNVGQILHALYQMRTVRFLADLESLYVNVFQPFKASVACSFCGHEAQ